MRFRIGTILGRFGRGNEHGLPYKAEVSLLGERLEACQNARGTI